ncbi:50S ribosome-binding GTPase [Candidatus Pacearchaeota archaeon]|nr:50S ribosome-binding GTPase [Candidatus Pacearchaeota archaeon]
MASTNQSPFYHKAEQKFNEASTDEERIECLEIMMKECPKHKSSENMRKNLTTRYKKLKSSIIKQKKAGKGKHAGIKKEDMQCVLIGPPNTGKSTIFKTLTKLNPKISPHPFTTYIHQLGTFKFEDAQIQIIDSPPFPNQDKSLINSTDILLLIIDNLAQIKPSEEHLHYTKAKKILLFNKEDELSEEEKRKIEATLKSKYRNYNYFFFSQKADKTKIEELKKKIFITFPIIRVYTKEPKKEASKEPMILKKDSTFKDAVEKILKGISNKIKRARIWGPSSKFGGQIIGLDHILKDKDIIEFQTK